jgi:hypothetical protein
MSNSKKTSSTKTNRTKTNSTKTNSTKTNRTNRTTNSIKTNNMKISSTKISSKKLKKSIGEIIEISLLLVAFGIVVEILFGGLVPMSNGILMNLIGLLNTLGDNGIIGLAALGVIVYIFRKGKVFA